MPDAAVLRPHRRRFSVGLRASAAALVALALLDSPAQAIDEFFPTFGNSGDRRPALCPEARRRRQVGNGSPAVRC